MTMTPEQLAAMREHYDSTDTSDGLADGRWETDAESDPMVTTSLRLPKSLLDWLRDEAAAEQVRPSALIRRYIEERRLTAHSDKGTERLALANLAARVDRLESVTLRVAEVTPAAAEDESGQENMTDLLTALQASVEAARGQRQATPRPPTREKRGA